MSDNGVSNAYHLSFHMHLGAWVSMGFCTAPTRSQEFSVIPIRQTEGELEASPLPLAISVGFHAETGPMLEPSVFVSARCIARHRMD